MSGCRLGWLAERSLAGGKIRLVTYTTFKRWRLLPGVSVGQVAELARSEIAPHYAMLSDRVTLGLDREMTPDDGPSAIATQRWEGRADFDAAFSSGDFPAWWEAYQPALERWGALVEFDAEWETETIF